jgi:hypothetical protein
MADPMAEPIAARRQRYSEAAHDCGFSAAACSVDDANRLPRQYATNQKLGIWELEKLNVIE